ncbi:MAG: transglutaminase domain-containing protein [Gammaproteobacteria bacterium]|nr:transglutaminase domain-containing protein [Gammaproteobacteria bacterium]
MDAQTLGTLSPLRLERAPPLLMAAGLIVWGWQNGLMLYAVPMALTLEATRWVAWRWAVTDREFNLVSDLSSVIFLIVVLYVFTDKGAKGIFVLLSLMPFVFFLLLLVQMYSEAGRVRLSALFISLRRLDPRYSPEARAEVDLSLPYFVTCLVSASAGNRYEDAFFFVVGILLGVVLWTVRPRRYPPALWIGTLVLATALGYLGQVGLIRLQWAVESSLMQVFDRFLWRYRDPNRATTAIGSIARIKLSDRIVLRAKTPQPLTRALLLREASYDTYSYGIWSNRDYEFISVDPDITGTIYALSPVPTRDRITLSTYLIEESGVVPMPLGATRIGDTNATAVDRNSHGAIRLEARKGWVRYTAGYGDGPDPDAPPEERDLKIAVSYGTDFQRLADRLGLDALPPNLAVSAVRDFFADGFTYSLTQRHRYPRGRYLTEFLFETRSGHCEFFATATVLLLRAGGVPARYVVGYAVDEYSPLERQYVARARHSHSWAEAWVNGAWVTLDTTPSVWAPLEDEQASAFEGLFDLWSWLAFNYARLRTSDDREEESDYGALLWLLIPLISVLAWRLYFKERVARGGKPAAAAALRSRQGMDSSFFAVIAELERRGFDRRPGETVAAWMDRLRAQSGIEFSSEPLALHYRCRFDPAGLSVNERHILDAEVRRALTEFARRAIANSLPGTTSG